MAAPRTITINSSSEEVVCFLMEAWSLEQGVHWMHFVGHSGCGFK